MRPSAYVAYSIEPPKQRVEHSSLECELAAWLAQGNQIKQLPTEQNSLCFGNWKEQEKTKGRVK